jgi:hypothetical protein
VEIPPGGEVAVELENTFELPPTTTTTTTVPGTTTTTTPVSPTSVAPTTTDPGTLPDTGGGSLQAFLLVALTIAGLGCVVLAWSRFPRLDDGEG